MIRKLLVAGALALLALSPSIAPARAQQFAPVPTTPSPTTTTSPTASTTSTTEPPTTVQRSTDFADTGPRDWIGILTLAGVVSFALGVSLRGKRAPGAYFFDRR